MIDKLAAGGMGVVYLAEDPALDRRIALKVVRGGMTRADLVARGEAARLDGELGAFANRWAGAYRAACLANTHGELTAPIATLQQALLQIESLDRPRTGARSDPA